MIGSKKAGFVACAISLVSVLAGCGGGSNGFVNSSQGINTLPGTWIKRGLSFQGRAVTCPNSIDMSADKTVTNLSFNNVVVDSCGYDETITFGSDGTYDMVIPAPRLGQLTEERGTYSLSDNKITLTSRSVGFDADGSGKIDTAELTTLASAISGSVPANPRRRTVYEIEATASTLTLTSVVLPVTDSSGNAIVNSDGTVNASVSGDTIIYAR